MFLRIWICMSFASLSSPNLSLSLHNPPLSHPSLIPFPLSLNPNPKYNYNNNNKNNINIKYNNNNKNNRLNSLNLALPPTPSPKEGRISLRKLVMYQLRVSLQTYGLGENMAKNPSKDPHIQGVIIDVVVQKGVWPENKWSETKPTRECS